jgi:2-polyprenyl-3-methyl-5-hydroxy-6-metoxy-1,4-benzoquinol methylase
VKQNIEEKFDIAVLMEVYEHIHPEISDDFCRSLASLINPGGILYLTVPHVNKHVEYTHYRHFTSDILANELYHYFEKLDFVYIETMSFRKKIIDCVLANRLFILNNKRVASWLYFYYINNLFFAKNETSCQRLVVRAKRRSD